MLRVVLVLVVAGAVRHISCEECAAACVGAQRLGARVRQLMHITRGCIQLLKALNHSANNSVHTLRDASDQHTSTHRKTLHARRTCCCVWVCVADAASNTTATGPTECSC